MPQFFSVGDVVKFHQNAKDGFRKGETYEILGIEQREVLMVKVGETSERLLNLDSAQHYGVFRSECLPVATGDRSRLLKNSKSAKGSRLYNGSVYQVTAFHGNEMVLDGKHRVPIDSGIFDHGYVSTSHSSQGKTCDKVIISQSSNSLGASSAEQFYVSASRGRDQISIWTDSKADLLDAVMKSDQRLLASEFVAQRAVNEELSDRN